jgi:hypothetical protein
MPRSVTRPLPRSVTQRLKALDRPPTPREVARLHQQLNQLAIAAPEFATAIAFTVNAYFRGLLKTGHVVPIPKAGR